MAYDLQARFRQLRAATSDNTVSTAPSILSRDNRCDELGKRKQLGGDDWESALQDTTPCEYLVRDPASDITREAAARPLDGDFVATPPINVPIHHTESAEIREDDAGFLPDSRYHEPSPLDEFFRRRRPSINFNPEVTLEDGHRVTLEQPLPKLQIKTGSKGRSLFQELSKRPQRAPLERPHSDTDYNRDSAELLSTSFGRNRQTRRDDRYTLNQSRYPLLQSTVDDLALSSPPSDFEQSVSLTSQTTASPILEEARTPPNVQMDCLVSPLLAYSPWHQPTSYEESSAWPKPQKFVSGSRAKSYTCDRLSNVRRRQSSRRSTNTSISPATTYLSRWKHDEETCEPDDEGQEVGDYVLGKEIGFGGFSVVREAYTISGNERIKRAVKIVRRQLVNKGEADNERLQAEFEHEVSLWRCLSHKQILPLIAVYITDFATFAFTPLNSGGTLFDLVRANRQGLRPDIARRYAYQLASAIRYLHEDVRVVHRDLKLENCLIDLSGPDAAVKGGNLLLCDFGLADFFSKDDRSNPPPTRAIGPSETSTSIAGSLQYAAPELILSPVGLLSTAVDMWAYGVVCYTLVTGDLPFQHTLQPRVQKMILAGEWDQAAMSKGRGWAEGVEDMVRGCLLMNPKERWSVGRCLEGRWLGAYEEPENRGWGA
ncbi:hypothetical protein MMC30_004565 [Trapelia coarctata]|nr:hypothetical protein [Trapelia coarctata]